MKGWTVAALLAAAWLYASHKDAAMSDHELAAKAVGEAIAEQYAQAPMMHPICGDRDQFVAHSGGPTPARGYCVHADWEDVKWRP